MSDLPRRPSTGTGSKKATHWEVLSGSGVITSQVWNPTVSNNNSLVPVSATAFVQHQRHDQIFLESLLSKFVEAHFRPSVRYSITWFDMVTSKIIFVDGIARGTENMTAHDLR